MTMSVKAIDRIFARLSATYGAAWERSLGSAPLADVKSAWAHELAGFADRLNDVAWALERLPERCPNVLEFRSLCRQSPTPEVPRIEGPRADPARVQQELAKLQEVRTQMAAATTNGKAWARSILAQVEAGHAVSRYRRESAEMALGMRARMSAA